MRRLENIGRQSLNLMGHMRVVAVNSAGTSDFITHYPHCVPSAMSSAFWGLSSEEYFHVGARTYLSFRDKEPQALKENNIKASQLATPPGVGRLADLLIKGANWLHDERDVSNSAAASDMFLHARHAWGVQELEQGSCLRRFELKSVCRSLQNYLPMAISQMASCGRQQDVESCSGRFGSIPTSTGRC